MWSVGCIFAEPVTKQALFQRDSELQQLLHIFRFIQLVIRKKLMLHVNWYLFVINILTCLVSYWVNETVWQGVTKLKEWHEYPQWSPRPLSTVVPGLDEEGLKLLSMMLQFEPSKRISAKKAMEHPYFDDLDKALL